MSRDVAYNPIPGDSRRFVQALNVHVGFLGSFRLDILFGFGLGFLGSIGIYIKYLLHRSLSMSKEVAYKLIPGDPGRPVPA